MVYFGSGGIGLPALRALLAHPRAEVRAVVTQPDRPAGRGLEVTAPPVKAEAVKAGCEVLQPERLRGAAGDEVYERLARLGADFFVVFAYGQIFPERFLALPRRACVNAHASLLPRHRGAAPVQAAILAGDRESGVCLMHMTPELDAGDVILERRVRLRRRETGGSLHDRLAELAAPVLIEGLDALADGRAGRRPQDPAGATYAPKLDRSAGRVNWSAGAEEIERLIRAMNPWPGAWALLPGPKGAARVKIFCALRLARSGRSAGAAPGTILGWDRRGIRVAAGRGVLVLREVQQEGRRRMDAAAFAAGWGGSAPPAFL